MDCKNCYCAVPALYFHSGIDNERTPALCYFITSILRGMLRCMVCTLPVNPIIFGPLPAVL